MTSISKLSNCTYFSGAFKLNDSCFRVGLTCLFLCTSLVLSVPAPDLGPTSTSLSTITAAVATWIGAWLTIDWIALDSAISAWIHIFSCISSSIWVNLPAYFTFIP